MSSRVGEFTSWELEVWLKCLSEWCYGSFILPFNLLIGKSLDFRQIKQKQSQVGKRI